MVGLGCASIAFSLLCGCSWKEIFHSSSHTLPNAVAVDRALKLCSLSEGEQPYHLILEIFPPAHAAASTRGPDMRAQNLRAQVEIFWLNPITYRTEIRSEAFTQTRIVNGDVVDERNTGDFYPRWIENFVDAILDPVPQADKLRKIPGSIPIGVQAHACISTPAAPSTGPDEAAMAQVCFQSSEPRIASGSDFTRSVWFDDFQPFGSQQIARRLINDLPANELVQGQITFLETLPTKDYPLLRARVFTPASKQIQTILVSRADAQSQLELSAAQSWNQANFSPADKQAGAPMTVYIRTDRKGRVREAYRDNADQFGLQNAALAHALLLQFKPLIVNGVPRQMEAPLVLPSRSAVPPSLAVSRRRR